MTVMFVISFENEALPYSFLNNQSVLEPKSDGEAKWNNIFIVQF